MCKGLEKEEEVSEETPEMAKESEGGPRQWSLGKLREECFKKEPNG